MFFIARVNVSFTRHRNILNRTILLDGGKHIVVGVMRAGFQWLETEERLWVPLALTAEDLANRGGHYLTVIARLKTGVVRLALGATRANILLLVLRKGMKLTLLGVCNRVGVVVCADSFDDFVALRCEGVRSVDVRDRAFVAHARRTGCVLDTARRAAKVDPKVALLYE